MSRTGNAVGIPVHVWSRTRLGKRIPRMAQTTKPKWYVVRGKCVEYLVYFTPWTGSGLVAVDWVERGTSSRAWSSPLTYREMGMRKLTASSEGAPRPRLAYASKVFAKYPVLSDFLSATAYDDGTARTPGYSTIRNRIHCYEITLYDPDSGQRGSVTAVDFDSVHAAAEAFLGAETAPWGPDDYLMEQLEKRKKKKK